MKVGRFFVLTLIVMALAAGACMADVDYVGDFFSCGIPTEFCGQVSDDSGFPVGVPVYFKGFNLWGQDYYAGLDAGTGEARQTTVGLGIACALETWQPNVYKVVAVAGDEEQESSFPVAVTIIDRNWCGIFAGGQLCLDSIITGNGVSLQTFSTQNRTASLGFIFQQKCLSYFDLSRKPRELTNVELCPGPRTQLLLLDPEGCTRLGTEGPTKIVATNFRVWAQINQNYKIKSILATGYCKFTQGGDETKTYLFDMTLTPYNKRTCEGGEVCIKVYNYLRYIVYKAEGKIKNGDVKFSDVVLPPG